MNKKSYVRTIESIIAILILLTIVYLINPRQPSFQEAPAEISLLQDIVLNEIEQNETFRQSVLNNDTSKIQPFIAKTLNLTGNYNFKLVINDIDQPYTIPNDLPSKKDIYTKSIFISANLTKHDPKLVSLYFWELI